MNVKVKLCFFAVLLCMLLPQVSASAEVETVRATEVAERNEPSGSFHIVRQGGAQFLLYDGFESSAMVKLRSEVERKSETVSYRRIAGLQSLGTFFIVTVGGQKALLYDGFGATGELEAALWRVLPKQ